MKGFNKTEKDRSDRGKRSTIPLHLSRRNRVKQKTTKTIEIVTRVTTTPTRVR